MGIFSTFRKRPSRCRRNQQCSRCPPPRRRSARNLRLLCQLLDPPLSICRPPPHSIPVTRKSRQADGQSTCHLPRPLSRPAVSSHKLGRGRSHAPSRRAVQRMSTCRLRPLTKSLASSLTALRSHQTRSQSTAERTSCRLRSFPLPSQPMFQNTLPSAPQP